MSPAVLCTQKPVAAVYVHRAGVGDRGAGDRGAGDRGAGDRGAGDSRGR